MESGTVNPAVDPVARSAFVMHVHELLLRAFNVLNSHDLHASEEEDITGELARAIETILEEPDAPEWAIHITLHEEKRKSHSQRRGKKRLRLDFEFERTGRGRRPRYVIEAKRLDRNHHVGGDKGYLGAQGMGAFLSGEYAAHETDAGMLGYVQSQSPDHWLNGITKQLAANDASFAIEAAWNRAFVIDKVLVVHQTSHRRVVGHSPITIYHVLLDFRRK